MTGPLNPYLADVAAALGPFGPSSPGAQLAGIGTPSVAPVLSGAPLPALAPPPNATGFPSLADVPAPPPPAPAAPIGPPAPPPTPGMSLPTDNPNALVSQPPPNMSVSPAPPIQVGTEPGPPPPPPPQPGPDPHAFDLQAVAGGSVPAHEVDLRGPSLLAAQGNRNAMFAGANEQIRDNTQNDAEDARQLWLSQERLARVREEAANQAAAEQEDEMQTRLADFDDTTRQLSRLGQIDHGRFWASRSTPQKMAGAIEVMLAGFRGGPSMVMKRIDDDVRAQEFAYGAARDAANAKQTAFGMAMQKYNNVNAARAMARAAGQDILRAQLEQYAAKNKGTEAANHALTMSVALSNDIANQIANGIKFVPAQASGRYFVNPETGVIYNNKEAQEYFAKNREWRQADRTKTFDLGADIYKQHDKVDYQPADGGGMTPEQRGKLQMEKHEKQVAVDAMNQQFNAMISNPVLERLSPIRAARASLPGAPHHSPEEYDDKQELDTLNQQFLTTLGKVAKDNEGKPGVAMLKKFEEKFKINQGFDTKESAIKNIRDVQRIANDLYAQGGATPMKRELSPEAQKSLGGYSK